MLLTAVTHSVQLQVLCNILKGSILLGRHILTVNRITEVNIHLKTKSRVVIDGSLWLRTGRWPSRNMFQLLVVSICV